MKRIKQDERHIGMPEARPLETEKDVRRAIGRFLKDLIDGESVDLVRAESLLKRLRASS